MTRSALEVEVGQLPPGSAIFLSCLMTGKSPDSAASAAFAESPSFDLPANIRGLLESGLVHNDPLRWALTLCCRKSPATYGMRSGGSFNG